ncbi:cytochrome P450 [Nocardia sp. IFM 10818]
MEEFLLELIERKRATPSDDFLSDLVAARDADNDRLTEDELVSLAFLIFWAGYQNSVDLIGNSILALLDNPDQLATLQASPEISDEAIEELLRYTHPSQFGIRRFPTENPHLAFGHGIHYCLGAPLARLEARIALRSILQRFPALTLAVPRTELPWRPSFREHGLRALPANTGSGQRGHDGARDRDLTPGIRNPLPGDGPRFQKVRRQSQAECEAARRRTTRSRTRRRTRKIAIYLRFYSAPGGARTASTTNRSRGELRISADVTVARRIHRRSREAATGGHPDAINIPSP